MQTTSPSPLRWALGTRILALGAVAIGWFRWQEDWAFQQRNLISYEIALVTLLGLLIWWLFLSRAPAAMKVKGLLSVAVVVLISAILVRIEGTTGDLVPILRWRWSGSHASMATTTSALAKAPSVARQDYPQFYGPSRNGVLAGPALAEDWSTRPPQELWRVPVGAGWSGFAIVGDLCITQEQSGEEECISTRDIDSGKERWSYGYPARYATTIGGEGPRATPTVHEQRVYALGSTGLLHCVELATGHMLWKADTVKDASGAAPEWGACSSPLIWQDKVIVHGGEKGQHSLLAYRINDGSIAWRSDGRSSYCTPIIGEVAGLPQLLTFHDKQCAGHDPATGAVLWRRPFGNGNVLCASPVIVSPDSVLFSAGYGAGAQLLQLSKSDSGVRAEQLWQSTKMKAKFSHLYVHDGAVIALDDGMLACVDLRDGSRLWREGRYGHGQGLAVGEHYLLMAEQGDLVLLHPTREAPHEIARHPVLHAKTWNPIALSGDLLLVRNDREAVCMRLALQDDVRRSSPR